MSKNYISEETISELEKDFYSFLNELNEKGNSGKKGLAAWFTVDFDNYDPERRTGLSVRTHMEYGDDPRESC